MPVAEGGLGRCGSVPTDEVASRRTDPRPPKSAVAWASEERRAIQRDAPSIIGNASAADVAGQRRAQTTGQSASVVLFAAVPGAAQTPAGDQTAVVAVVDQFHAGLTSGNPSVVMQLIADDAILHGGRQRRDARAVRGDHLPADIEFEKTTTTKRSAIRVVVVGTTAWASSTSETTGTFQGRTIDSIGGELMVLSRDGSGWRIRAIHWSGRARPRPQ